MSLLQEFEKERRARLARILAAAVPDHGIDLKRKPEPPPRPQPEPEPPRDWLYVGSGFEQRNRVHIIVSAVCVHFSISPNELKSACRIHPIVRARHVASFLLRELLALSLPKIGTILGGRDHTTILNGCKRIRDRMNSPEGDPDVVELINRVRGLPDMTDLMKNYDLWKCRSPDDDRPPDEFDDQPQGEEETVSEGKQAEQHLKDDGGYITAAARVLIGMVRGTERAEGGRATHGDLELQIELTGGGVETWLIRIERTASSH